MRSLVCMLGLLLSVACYADETFDVTPAPAGDVVARWHLSGMTLGTPLERDQSSVTIVVQGVRADGKPAMHSNGRPIEIVTQYREKEAIALLNQLNTMNFSTTSLRKRILQRLSADKVLPAGVVAGDVGIATPTPAETPTPG